MDVVITPFWIILSGVYFWLAAIHYKRRFMITPSIYISSALTEAPDNAADNIRYLRADIQMVFKQFIRDIEQNRELMKYASIGFFVAGVVSLLQGLTNLEAQFSVNILFAVIAAIIVLSILYWRRRWVLEPFIGPIRNYWFRRKYNLKPPEGSIQARLSLLAKDLRDRIRGR